MSLQDKAKRLFEYIGQVFAIDLPADRDVRKYGAELWWQADLIPSPYCQVREFSPDNSADTDDGNHLMLEPEAWLSITKKHYDDPPILPEILAEWVTTSKNPHKPPSPKSPILRSEDFSSDKRRQSAYNDYLRSWQEWSANRSGSMPAIPDVLEGWVSYNAGNLFPFQQTRREFEENFEDSEDRTRLLKSYVENEWSSWAKRILPYYTANVLYDRLFSLHQRLGIEGDRIEIMWGHLFLAWNHSPQNLVYHPVILTPMNLSFDPVRRTISLFPSQTLTSSFDIGCLRDLDYPNKDRIIAYMNRIKDDNVSPDMWNPRQMKATAAFITGLISNEPAEITNLYSEQIVARPNINDFPAFFNAPLIFVRERRRYLWIEDAKKIAAAINSDMDIPPFIRALVANSKTGELPNPDDFIDDDPSEIEGEEHLLPLEYNDQQKEIVERLKRHFGVLVQGPPGTGKSHTIANIICSLLAKGKRVLVTSQTENALKVLRNFVPNEIRSLCVSQLGNDIEAKRQLIEAVDAIGTRLSERGSQEVEANIRHLEKELRVNREEQARIYNQIKDWAMLDSITIEIDGEKITAHEAARECAENEADHSWFPDELSIETAPPLTHAELEELCALIRDISSEDQRACQQYLPDQGRLLSPASFSKTIEKLGSVEALASKTQSLRMEWGDKLRLANSNDIIEAITILREGRQGLQQVETAWQQALLNLVVSDKMQEIFWRRFYEEVEAYHQEAWVSYQAIQGYVISVNLQRNADFNIGAALEELARAIEKGKHLASAWGRLGLSKPAKFLLKHAKVDDQPLTTKERVSITTHHFSYRTRLQKIRSRWNQGIRAVNGPPLDMAVIMPLAIINDHLGRIRAVLEWKNNHYGKIKERMLSLGCRAQEPFHMQSALQKCLTILHGKLAEDRRNKVLQDLDRYHGFLRDESQKDQAHQLLKELAEATRDKAVGRYEKAYKEFSRLLGLRPKVERLKFLAASLRQIAPNWFHKLEHAARQLGSRAVEQDWKKAWRWRRLDCWLRHLHSRETVDSLQNRLKRTRDLERQLLERIVIRRTWKSQIENVKNHHYQALVAWADAMKRYGKGKGGQASRWLNEAAKAMTDAVGAVPAWIMPLHRVIQSFPAEPAIFDVIITDESSQCDIRALQVLFRGKKVLVVGDPEQISPSNVGIQRGRVHELIRQYLSDIPFAATTFTIENSLYDITKSIPQMNHTLLTEHFRCVPEIIAFNNDLCPSYGGKLEPLRQPNPEERLDPPIQTSFIVSGFKNDIDVNAPEAEALVDMLVRCCQCEKYAKGGRGENGKRTMGVISLLGENQAKYISQLIAAKLDEKERAERQIICGDAYAFQGDERDVMFLSLVVAPKALFKALVTDADRQRFNVATSRARDQVFLFHSVRLEDIKNPGCVRYKLLNWYQHPPLAEIQAGIEILRQKAESDFEIEVGQRLIHRGYKVIPQYRAFPNDMRYRIDLVIQGNKNRVAVECDGDRWHGPDKWEHDQRREAQLRRTGWKFWRIGGSAFYRNRERSLDPLWAFLEAEGIRPELSEAARFSPESEGRTGDQTVKEPDLSKPQVDSFGNLGDKTPPVIIPILEKETENIVKVGSIVKVYDELNDRKYVYKIGMQYKDKPGYVSPVAPVGRALIGCRLNDTLEIEVPGGIRILEVVEIKHPDLT